MRVKRKLIRKSTKTDTFTIARLRRADAEQNQEPPAESRAAVTPGTLSFGGP